MAEASSMSPEALHTHNVWPRPAWWVWFGVLGGPLAWAAQLALGWFVSGSACMAGTPHWGALSKGGVQIVQALVAIACIAMALAALGCAWKAWRASRNQGITQIHANDRPDYLAAVGVVVSALFVAGLAWNAMAQLWLPLCERIR
ncbi:hypothetical protein [Azohydromonas australica]|uniref:hypothetical protein n=1 Tax=Azohydromonas australica TaxID=364039 RepID=UPI000410E349|nr:hypothetical protein [Azohydromonas australica]